MKKTEIISGNGKDGVDGKSKVRNEVLPLGRWPDHAQLLFQNHHNFKESGKPLRFKMYKDGFRETCDGCAHFSFCEWKGYD
ncbi:hypothetical protein H5410_020234 [Solanum commersonii]|uniref:Uncharacterized protein n=1 Tax=Solanum commersonii TaxID=4109 RepID=A0A9J5Z7V4_SOLCO|nr:hypothetical protein H5410_020234 [Solanum commersonii]